MEPGHSQSLGEGGLGAGQSERSADLYWRSSSGTIEVFTFQVRIIRCLPSDVTRPAKHGRGPLPVCTCKHDHPRHDTASIASPRGARLVGDVQQYRAFQRTAAARRPFLDLYNHRLSLLRADPVRC